MMSEIQSFFEDCIKSYKEEAFFVFDVEDVIVKHEKWNKLLPRVIPHYAVKCNNVPILLEIMAGLDMSFDCASQAEIEAILSCGVQPKKIIFSNTIKSKAFLHFSKSVGVDLMTFDNEEELNKMKSIFPEARLVLRIKVDDTNSSAKLGLKFGADVKNIEPLLKKAKLLEQNVVGISFHVGSGCQSSDSYSDAIKNARMAFDIGIELGYKMNLLDIGGGFPGSDQIHHKQLVDQIATFEEIADKINQSLDVYFPETGELTIIAEPGRFFTSSAFNLFTSIISKRIDSNNDGKQIMYYLNDGIYGSFMSVLIDNEIVKPIPILKNANEDEYRKKYPCILWGPTCDSYDCIRKDFEMIEMNVGERLVFSDMGSYTLSTSSNFNGMPSSKLRVFVSSYVKSLLMKMKNWHKIENLIHLIKSD